MEAYNVNTSRLVRYAARKGKKEEVNEILSKIDKGRLATIKGICKVLSTAPVLRAWLFGSYARMEEKPDSDIDILVSLDKSAHIGLMAFSGLVNQLEQATGRAVDLVPEESLKPYARESVNRDKYLVYERA
ncbi:MAG: nucleotidyltransferase domain-containing protein [Bacteroidales bacterium]|nr:nucleotidyltransferase domain-containing protein [Bacteroidales bacterium]